MPNPFEAFAERVAKKREEKRNDGRSKEGDQFMAITRGQDGKYDQLIAGTKYPDGTVTLSNEKCPPMNRNS